MIEAWDDYSCLTTTYTANEGSRGVNTAVETKLFLIGMSACLGGLPSHPHADITLRS